MSAPDLSGVSSQALYAELSSRGVVAFIGTEDLKGYICDTRPGEPMPTEGEMLEALAYAHRKFDFGDTYCAVYDFALEAIEIQRKEGGAQ